MIAYEDTAAAIDWLDARVRVHRARRALRHGGRDDRPRRARDRRPGRHAGDPEPGVSEPEDAPRELRACGALARQPVGDRRPPRRWSTTSTHITHARSRRGADVIRRSGGGPGRSRSTRPRTSKGIAGCSSRHDHARRVPHEPRPRAVRRGVRAAAVARRRGVAGRDAGDRDLPRAPAGRHDRAADGDRRASSTSRTTRASRSPRPTAAASRRSTGPGSSSATRSSTSASTART